MNKKKESKNGYVPIREVAKMVGVDLQTISRWIKKKKIPKPHKDYAERRFYRKEQIEQIEAYYLLMRPPDPEVPTLEPRQ